MAERLLSNWLDAYMEYTKDHEAPESIHRWTGLVLLSAVIRRKIYLELEHGIVYPNLYVIVVGESARVRKSVATKLGLRILEDAVPELRVMSDSMTSQGLIHALNHPMEYVEGSEIKKKVMSDVVIFADEVANLFSYQRERSAQMTIFLTTTYECPSKYTHTTVRDKTVILENVYPVLLGCTDPRNLKVIPDEAAGGLTGRLIWVIESERRNNNSGWKRDPTKLLRKQVLREALVHDLHYIATLAGEVTATPEAMEFYDNWYNDLSKRETRDPNSDAFYQRCHTTAQRIAILLSIATDDSKIITLTQIEKAVKWIEAQLPEVKRALMWSGGSDFEQKRAKLLLYIERCGGATKLRLALKQMGMTKEDFLKLVDTLVVDGSIETPRVIGADTALKLTKEGFAHALSASRELVTDDSLQPDD